MRGAIKGAVVTRTDGTTCYRIGGAEAAGGFAAVASYRTKRRQEQRDPHLRMRRLRRDADTSVLSALRAALSAKFPSPGEIREQPLLALPYFAPPHLTSPHSASPHLNPL